MCVYMFCIVSLHALETDSPSLPIFSSGFGASTRGVLGLKTSGSNTMRSGSRMWSLGYVSRCCNG